MTIKALSLPWDHILSTKCRFCVSVCESSSTLPMDEAER